MIRLVPDETMMVPTIGFSVGESIRVRIFLVHLSIMSMAQGVPPSDGSDL